MAFSKTVTWTDLTTDTIQIDANNNFILNGDIIKPVGMAIQENYPGGEDVDSAAGLAFYEQELAYLQSIGVRVIHFQIKPDGENEVAVYTPVFNLFKEYKMFLFVLVTAVWFAPASLTPSDFEIGTGSGYYVHDFVANCCTLLNNYDNVFCISADNELDMNLFGKAYTLEAATDYMSLLKTTIRANIDDTTIPITSKLVAAMGGVWDQYRAAFLPYLDVMCFDLYQQTSALVKSRCAQLYTWLVANGYTKKAWISEFDARDSNENDYSPGFTPAFAQEAISAGMALQILWTSYNTTPNTCFFSSPDGTTAVPKTSLVNLALVLDGLQGITPAPERRVVATIWHDDVALGYLDSIDISKLTHLIWQGLSITAWNDPTLKLINSWNNVHMTQIDTVISYAHGSGAKAYVSLYGDGYFNQLCDNNSLRVTLISNIVALFTTYSGLDGIYLEYVTPLETIGNLFLTELTTALTGIGVVACLAKYRPTLTDPFIAPYPFSVETADLLEFMVLQTYDMENFGTARFPYHSLYADTMTVVQDYGAYPTYKIVLGLACYGRDSSGVLKIPYSQIVDIIAPAATQDSAAMTSLQGVPIQGGVLWWGGVALIRTKVDYVVAQDIGGLFLNDIGKDKFNSTNSIISTVYAELNGMAGRYCIGFTSDIGEVGGNLAQVTELVYGYVQPTSNVDLTLAWVNGDWSTFDTMATSMHDLNRRCLLQVHAPNDGNYADYNKIYTDEATKSGFISQLSDIFAVHPLCDGFVFDWESDGETGVTPEEVTAFYADLHEAIAPLGYVIAAIEGYGKVTLTNEATSYLEWIGLIDYDVTPESSWYGTISDITTDTTLWEAAGFSLAGIVVGINIKARQESNPSIYQTRRWIVETYNPANSLNSTNGYNFCGLTLCQTKAQKIVADGLAGAFVYDIISDAVDSRSALNAISNILLGATGGGGGGGTTPPDPWIPPEDPSPPDYSLLEVEYAKRVKTPIIEVTVTRFSESVKPSVEGIGTDYRPDVIRCEINVSFDQGVRTCTLTIKSPLDESGNEVVFYPMDRVLVRQGWNYSSTLATTFFGFVDTVQKSTPPLSQQLQCKDILKLAQDNYYVQTNKRVYYSQISTTEKTVSGAAMGGQLPYQRTAQAIFTDLLVESGIPESRLLLSFPPYEDPGAIVFGENTQVVVAYESALEAIQRMCDLIGFRMWSDKSGLVRCDNSRPFAGENYSLLYTSELDYYNDEQGFGEDVKGTLISLECNKSDDLRNEVTVYGYEGLQPSTTLGDSPYVPDPPRYKRTEVKSYILDTPELLAAASLRIYEDLNRLRYTGRATIEGDPRLEIGLTVGVYDEITTNGETINYFLNDYSSTFEAGNWTCELGFVGGLGTGSPAYSNRSPVALIQYRVEKESIGASTIWDVFLDGSQSYDPNGPFGSLSFIWGITGIEGVTELYGVKQSFIIQEESFSVTATLYVTDSGEPPLSSSTKVTITSNGIGADSAKSRYLFVASGKNVYSSADGGATWLTKELF